MNRRDEAERAEIIRRAEARWGRPFVVEAIDKSGNPIDIPSITITTAEDAEMFIEHRTGSLWQARDMRMR